MRLREGRDGSFVKLQLKYLIRIKIEEDNNMQIGQLKFVSAKTGNELAEIFN
jgi:hypothetical protein